MKLKMTLVFQNINAIFIPYDLYSKEFAGATLIRLWKCLKKKYYEDLKRILNCKEFS
jgi:hypothetical protein